MAQPPQKQVACPNCGQPFMARLEQIVDGGRNPLAKARLLSGQLNVNTCPACGFQFALATPLVYHDAGKELLLTHIPMELNLPGGEQERLIGAMTNAIINSLPQEERKGYLLMPKTMLTMQSLIETVLEADGITKEMIEARRARLQLAEQFLQADPETWPALALKHDSEIDEEFFGMLMASADAAMANQRQDVAEHMLALRDRLLELTTAGQALIQETERQEGVLQDVAKALEALGEKITREDLVELAIQLGREDEEGERLQALVGMIRPALDYQFFMALAQRIEEASAEEQPVINRLRQQLVGLIEQVDKQAEAVVGRAVNTLQTIVNSSDLDSAIRARLDLIDDTFMAVLTSNIQHAEQSGSEELRTRLNQVFERVMAILEENAPAPLRFINTLMRAPDLEAAKGMLAQHVHEFGDELLQLMDVLLQEMTVQKTTPAMVDLLRQLRAEAAALLGDRKAPPSSDGRDPDKSPIVLPFERKRPKLN